MRISKLEIMGTVLFIALWLLLWTAIWSATPAFAQDTEPLPSTEPLPPPFEALTNEAGAYLTSLSVLALALQTALTFFNLFFERIKATITDERAYLVVYFIVRAVIAYFALTTFGGGVEALRAVAPTLLAFVPDLGVLVASTLLIVLGDEILRPLIQLVYDLRDFLRTLSKKPA